ncbi:hypothetical protein O7627_24295 [Solwaraspora sp. WMMD1047]|uniref:hypothetical protein n=1 Tax=Solwaraspora sp. WMMD1047 TaxID=3016102 RepID=UPI002417E31E|nr:hypothetical protein [Solwaraspora sp. WMMD1047]MDG4832404.1 hypothetical protein [Solwaraspora sp. WMMD1047]
MTVLPRHRTVRERAAQAAAAAAIARAQAHHRPPDPDPWPTWPPSPAAWRRRCHQIRRDIEAERTTR